MVNKKVSLLSSLLLLTGCSAQIDEYSSQEQFDIKSYFNGQLVARGVIQDYRDKLIRRFCVEIDGQWQDDQGLLAETFYFDDGEISYRNWKLKALDHGQYLGKAEDVVGDATGTQSGIAFNLNYTLSLPLENTNLNVSMDDWMYQLDEHRVLNKTTMSKWGVNLADITIIFDKSEGSRCI